ncbi:FANCI [Trypoxylus dichotomus]
MQQIEKQVQAYGQTRNITDLQSYVDSIDVDEIKLLIKKRVNYADFSAFWNYLLQALDTERSQDKRYELVTTCINEIKDRNINTPHTNSVITRLCMELPKFSTRHLMSLCLLCMQFIQQGDVTEACWRELLPEVLNVLTERQHVEFNLNEMSGVQFKIQYINSLCMLDWSTNIVTPLTVMFMEMPLSKEEHLQVTHKLVSYLEKLTPQEIPAFVYQILRFCRNQNSRLVFHKLQEYFGLRIYMNILSNDSSEDTISDTLDEESIQAESTVLYHIYQTALLGHESIKDYLSSLKNFTKSPEFILHPFQLSVLLTLSTVTFCEDKVFELIRQSISRSFREDLKKSECFWLRDLVPETLDLENTFVKIIQNSLNDRDLVIQGLVNLSFVLLGVGTVLVKEKHHTAHTILQKLYNHIVLGNNIVQYVDCFRSFALKFTYITLENKSCVLQLMDSLVSVPEYCAEAILDTVIPLTKVSPTLRDHLILLLRKALYSRSTETRYVAVRGFLKVLTKLKIQNLTALSQINSSSSSGHSVLTQISLHRSGHSSQPSVFSNEALCLEVLNILRRCYMQQTDIRSKLYEGLNDAVNQNSDLALPVLNVLWSQFLKYYNDDEETLPPIDFSKISIIRDVDVVIQEPIGQLVCAINFLVVKIQELEDEDTNAKKFVDTFESMCRRLIKCELTHFDLDDGTNLADILPECKKKVATLKEAMRLYECLIGYKIWSWNKSSQSHAQQIIALFQGYFRLQHCAKNATKLKQKVDKKKKDLNKTTQQNRNTQRTQTSQQNRTTQGQPQTSQQQDPNDRQNENVFKGPKAIVIKTPPTILNFPILIKFLGLLHENVTWTTAQQANLLKVKHDIHQHVMQATAFQLQQLNTRKGLERNKEYYEYCRDIAKIIYPRCIHRLEEFLEFDITTANLAVECFNIILNIVCTNYSAELKTFLCAVGGGDSHNDIFTCLMPYLEKYQKLFELDDSTLDDQEFKNILETVGNTLTLLISQIPVNLQNTKHMDWMKMFATKHTVGTKNIAKLFGKLWLSTYMRTRSTLSLFEDVISDSQSVLGTISDETEAPVTLKIINELTVETFIECLASVIKILLDNIDWMTNRLRAEYGVLVYAEGSGLEKKREKLSNRERSVSCQLCLLMSLMEQFCNVKVSIALSRTVIDSVLSLYVSLNSLSKYFISRSSKVNPVFQNARFECVVKLAGRQVAPAWDRFILFLEQNQLEENENPQTKKKNSSNLKNKVLKETKSIPKVVHEIEQFSKFIIQLSNKTKCDLTGYIGAGTTRDFRIRDLRNVMEKNKTIDTTHSDDDTNDQLSTVRETDEDSTEDDSPPKKRKISLFH